MERPILFSAPMVRALLAGTKTQTRRVVKPYPKWAARFPICNPEGMAAGHEVWWWNGEHDRVGVAMSCPHGAPADTLVVRETFRLPAEYDDLKPTLVRKDAPVWYEADGRAEEGWGKTRVSIHMPRWASRITLRITDVRVERLNDIGREDAAQEGWPPELEHIHPVPWFHTIWEHINGPDSWMANPWVWCVGFERVRA